MNHYQLTLSNSYELIKKEKEILIPLFNLSDNINSFTANKDQLPLF